jgi:nucleolar protein 56
MALALAALAGCGGERRDAHLTLPPPTPASEPAQIRISGLKSGEQVAVQARWRDADGRVWSGSRSVRAGAGGRAVVGAGMLAFLRTREPGPQWMRPVLGRNRIDLTIRHGSDALAHGTLVRDVRSADVRTRELTVARDGIAGAYFAPARPRGSAVLLFGGSEGGSDSVRPEAAQLATLGHPALVIAYFRAPGLPRELERVPVETVFRGMAWLREHAPGRPTAIMSPSRGAELALIAASLRPALARTVIALVPGAYILPGAHGKAAWTYRGRGLPQGVEIPVERIRGTVLVAGAGDDQLWSSADFAGDIARTIRAKGRARVVRLSYPGAGHGIADPLPFIPLPAAEDLGGTTRAEAAARQDLWPRIVALLRGEHA